MMIFLLFTIYASEDSLMFSTRIAALGYDFNFLIEDPVADVQFNPAIIGSLAKRAIYVRPDWNDNMYYYNDFGRISSAIFYPSFCCNVGMGFLGSLSYKDYSSIYNYGEFYGSGVGGDTSTYIEKKPVANLCFALPFLKSGGFLGLLLTLKNPQDDNRHGQFNWHYDTTYNATDSMISSYSSYYNNGSPDETFLWSLGIGQYLPFDNSEIGFSLSVSKNEWNQTETDSHYTEHTDTRIIHEDTIRELHFYKDIYYDYFSNGRIRNTWFTKIGCDWERDIPAGHFKIFTQVGLENGEYIRSVKETRYMYYEYRYEYTSNDSLYVLADTDIVNDTLKDISETGDILGTIAEIGVGYEKLMNDNINLLMGMKAKYYNNNIKITVPDTVETRKTNFLIIAPIGSEFFISNTICLRAGIAISYTNTTSEVIAETKSSFTNQYLTVNKSFGLGIALSERFRFDLSNTNSLASLSYWKLEILYSFR